ncbi:ParB-like partition protein [Xenococcus sp. PCC 7305]|uniref:ParB/RepB/Spo0J family partition protein n=1 Tax=Xenococcus sp. PCC 7305 TaxID=102125 RepID=UPI0002AC1BD0|nr:ParB/RepB/Spo0J family partition protein [Xenococcus sp. PCC 7305]ELS03443.1 ParB-like partition protein [Xenococcus sp. PCC 7305]
MSPRKRTEPPSSRTKLKNVALFTDQDQVEVKSAVTPTLPLEKIIISQQQPRCYFDPDKLEQLTISVKEHGILEPLLVRPLKDKNYELVAGERRFRAATAASLKEVPVIIKELNDKQALQLALIENLQRDDLNPVEETEGVLRLLTLHLDDRQESPRQLLYQMKNAIEKNKAAGSEVRDNVIPNCDSESEKTIQSVFESLGQNWYSFTCNRLPLLNLPEDILEALRQGKIAYTKAKAITTVKDETARTELLENAIANSWSLSQIRELITELKPAKQQEQLKTRLATTYKQVNKSKQLWQDPKKRKKLASLLSQLEKLIESESSSEAPESGLSDRELGQLLGVSSIVIRDCRVKKKQPPAALKKKLLEWEIQGKLWVRKSIRNA